MTRKYFGTDGIRGTVGQAPITPDFVLRLAHAVGRVLKKTEARPTVLIGKDTRISGYMLESALESGFNSAGVDVVLLGHLPTPGVAYLTRTQRASLGVVISASHNPFPDNGIKFFSAQGAKLPDAWEEEVEAVLEEAPVWADSPNLGKTRRLDDAADRDRLGELRRIDELTRESAEHGRQCGEPPPVGRLRREVAQVADLLARQPDQLVQDAAGEGRKKRVQHPAYRREDAFRGPHEQAQ